MLEKHALPDQMIVKCLNTNYGIDVTSLTFLPIGADANASIFKAQTRDQSSYFIKLKLGHHHDISVEIIELLHQTGVEQIIPPIKTVQGKPIQPIDDFSLIVYPFVEGQDGFSQSLTEDQWINLGKALHQVHETEVPTSIQKSIRLETYSSKWRDAVHSVFPYVEGSPITDEIGLKLQKFMKKHMLDINRAEELGKKLQHTSPSFVLCNSDIHACNVLLDNNSHIYIVDWDEPIMAPKERDLMFIGGGVGNVWNKPFEEQLFYEGYGKVEINKTALTYY